VALSNKRGQTPIKGTFPISESVNPINSRA
jgi:hypothetical protein